MPPPAAAAALAEVVQSLQAPAGPPDVPDINQFQLEMVPADKQMLLAAFQLRKALNEVGNVY